MPQRETIERARKAKRQGKAPSTQAGEFVREEIHHVREGKHGARSAKQAVAIGLSKARRAGVDMKPPAKGRASTRSRASAERARAVGQGATPKRKPSAKRASASRQALSREGKSAASHTALSKQASGAARTKSGAERRTTAKKAVETKGPERRRQAAMKAAKRRTPAERSASARKAARTRAANKRAREAEER